MLDLYFQIKLIFISESAVPLLYYSSSDVNIQILPTGVHTFHKVPVERMTTLDLCVDILQRNQMFVCFMLIIVSADKQSLTLFGHVTSQ